MTTMLNELLNNDDKKEPEKSDANNPGTTASAGLKWTGGRYSKKAFRGWFLMLVILTALYAGLLCPCHHFIQKNGLLNGLYWIVLIGVPLFFWIWFWAAYWYRTFTIRYRLEPDQLISSTGLFTVKKESTLVARMNDITFEQTLWDRLINGGTGTVVIHSSDLTQPTLRLEHIDNPTDAFDTLKKLISVYTQKKGIKTLGGDFSGDDYGVIPTDGGM